jgi:hypothetical protein
MSLKHEIRVAFGVVPEAKTFRIGATGTVAQSHPLFCMFRRVPLRRCVAGDARIYWLCEGCSRLFHSCSTVVCTLGTVFRSYSHP